MKISILPPIIIQDGDFLKRLTACGNEFGYDLVRIFAMFSVISLHFFLYSGFYELRPEGLNTVLCIMARTLFYQCVPLFVMLTGALKRNAVFGARHYIKLIPVIINSLLIGGIVIGYKILILDIKCPVSVWLRSLWTFSQPSYGWYVNMYISLFLLIPLINAAYNSLRSRNQKLAAVLVCVFVTTFASSVNRIPLNNSFFNSVGFVPDYFSEMWPLAYYAVGMFIGEFRPKISKTLCSGFVLVMILFQTTANYLTSTSDFYSGVNFENGDIINVITAAVIFLLLYDMKTENTAVKRISAGLSSLSASFYLLSWIGDSYFYTKYESSFSGYNSFPALYLKIIPLHFVLCIGASFVVSSAVKFISGLIMTPLLRLCDKKEAAAENSAGTEIRAR